MKAAGEGHLDCVDLLIAKVNLPLPLPLTLTLSLTLTLAWAPR